MAVKYVAIDSGKYATKAVTLKPDRTERLLVFRTKMEETNRASAQGTSFLVEYEGKKYILGEQAEVGSSKSSKAELIHKVAVYTALARLVESGDEVVAAVGCPLQVFENAETKEQYKKYLFPKGQIDIKVNGTTKHFIVKNVLVLAESSGIIYLEEARYADRMVGVVDIGGLNINCCVYNKGVPVLSSLFTDDLGSNVLVSGLRKELSMKYGEDLPLFQMEEILIGGFLRDNMSPTGEFEGSRELIQTYKREHVEKIIRQLQENGWNLRTMELVFVGGASELLRKEITKRFPAAKLYEDAALLNVRGFLKALTE